MMFYLFVFSLKLDQVKESKTQFEWPEGENVTVQYGEVQKLWGQKWREGAGGNLLTGLF